MQLAIVGFSTLVQRMSAAVQGRASALIDLSVGSVLRALLEACAASVLWIQWLTVQVMAMTRAATSVGSDLDSWVGDFLLIRLPAVPATGMVSFSRHTVGITASIAPGTLIRTSDLAVNFAVIADQTNVFWNTGGYYSLAAMIASIEVPVVATVSGSSGNVLAGMIAMLSTPIAGVDRVSNLLPTGGGLDAEGDVELRARFTQYINSRSLATPLAVSAAVNAVRQGLRVAVLENTGLLGLTTPGSFSVIVDDGGASPSVELLAAVSAAVDEVRPIATRFTVCGPNVVSVDVAMTVVMAAAANRVSIVGSIERKIVAWVNALPIGGALAISKLDAIAHSVDDAVLAVGSVSINGVGADIQAAQGAVLRVTLITVN